MKYQIEKPEKGSSLIEYVLKYITLFFVIGIGLWAFLIFVLTKTFSDSGLTENIYNYSLVLSFAIVIGVLFVLIKQRVNKLKLGSIYEFDFNDNTKELAISLVNEYTGEEGSRKIAYESLSIVEVKQKVEVKSEMTISIFNDNILVNTLKIAKTPWTAHSEIVQVVDKLRTVNSNSY